MGELIEAFADLRQLLGRQPAGSTPESSGPLSSQICHQADRQSGGFFEKRMLSPRGNEKDCSWRDGMEIPSDSLPSPASQIDEKLSMGMAVGALLVEGLQMAVKPKLVHRPVAAAQVKALKQDRPEWGISLFSGGFSGGRHEGMVVTKTRTKNKVVIVLKKAFSADAWVHLSCQDFEL